MTWLPVACAVSKASIARGGGETSSFAPRQRSNNFNGKRRTLYIPPWEERIVDLLLHRLLNRKLHRWFWPNSYAYRNHSYGLDHCQARIARDLRSTKAPVYVIKRALPNTLRR